MPFQVVPHARAKLHFAAAVCIVDASGSKGIHDPAVFGLQSLPSCVQLSGHLDILVGLGVITICGFISSLYPAKRRTVNTTVNATELRYSILSLIQGKEWILLATY